MKRFTILGSLVVLGLLACENPQAPEAWQPDFLPVSGTDNDLTGDPIGTSTHTFASTNEANYTAGLPHVRFDGVAVGQVTLEFVNNTNSLAFFEVRIDDEVLTSGTAHPVVTGDFIYPGVCVDNRTDDPICGGQMSSKTETFEADETVDVRLALGGERDWDFDWTRFYVLSLENKDQCKDGQWEALGFRNQGQCVRYVETGKDSRTGG